MNYTPKRYHRRDKGFGLGKTLFVDASALNHRKDAAKKTTKMHAEFAKEGWTVVNVAVYIENSDVERFFVTYVKE